MADLVGLVVGAALASGGGILGTYLTQRITRRTQTTDVGRMKLEELYAAAQELTGMINSNANDLIVRHVALSRPDVDLGEEVAEAKKSLTGGSAEVGALLSRMKLLAAVYEPPLLGEVGVCEHQVESFWVGYSRFSNPDYTDLGELSSELARASDSVKEACEVLQEAVARRARLRFR